MWELNDLIVFPMSTFSSSLIRNCMKSYHPRTKQISSLDEGILQGIHMPFINIGKLWYSRRGEWDKEGEPYSHNMKQSTSRRANQNTVIKWPQCECLLYAKHSVPVLRIQISSVIFFSLIILEFSKLIPNYRDIYKCSVIFR